MLVTKSSARPELLRREVFFEQMNAGYAAVRGDADAWAGEQRDVAASATMPMLAGSSRPRRLSGARAAYQVADGGR
jgi:hypothetical protein